MLTTIFSLCRQYPLTAGLAAVLALMLAGATLGALAARRHYGPGSFDEGYGVGHQDGFQTGVEAHQEALTLARTWSTFPAA